MKSVRERSILAVRIAKFGPLMQGTNQNALFHHGPVQPYNKKKNYYVAELVQGEKEHSDWLPERSEFCYTDR